MVEIFPSKVRKFWNSVELRLLVVVSLSLQVVLIATGNRRKYTRRKWVAIIIWLFYLSADAVATLALGVLSQTQGDIAESPLDPSYVIMAFWAPFLLMHLGGPDTITAYALADNELWSRHLLGLVAQVLVAIYVFLRTEKLVFLSSRPLSWDKAFGIIEVELGLIYDLFYTKAFLLSSGFIFRVFSCSSTLAAFIVFLIIDKSAYKEAEVIITYFLLVGAIILEIYAVLIFLSSDRMMIWLSRDWTNIRVIRKFKDPIMSAICKIVSRLQYFHIVPARMRWSNAMGQYNLLNCCLESTPVKCTKVHQYLEKYLFWNSVSVPNGLKALIFDELKERVNSGETDKQLGSYRGDKILLKERNCFDKSDEIEFDQSVLLWHIATDFCCHLDGNYDDATDNKTWLYEFVVSDDPTRLQENLKFKREMSKWLSDYMIHLLMMSPFMLPSGIGQIRFQDTCAEAIEFFEGQKLSKREACEKLLAVDTRIPPSEVKGDRSKSLLFDASRLVKSLNSLEIGQKWEIINRAWLDLLTFAAAQCRWNDHAEKLGQGGELLTHVWLLMAHFGMTDQFQISQGYVRSKLQLT